MDHGNPMSAGLILVALFLYFLPWIVAIARNHHQRSAIALLTLLLGWTGLGWICALVWSATAIPAKEIPHA